MFLVVQHKIGLIDNLQEYHTRQEEKEPNKKKKLDRKEQVLQIIMPNYDIFINWDVNLASCIFTIYYTLI